jgi:hypothetical protein
MTFGRAKRRRILPARSPFAETESGALSSCRQTTSGSAVRNQSRRLARRLFTLLMLKVAIFIRQPVSHTIGPQGGDLTENRQAFDQPSGEDR